MAMTRTTEPVAAGVAQDHAPNHLSHSQVQTFAACPRKWHYDKVAKALKERVGSALAFGIAVHDTLAAANEASMYGESIDAPAAFIVAWKEALGKLQAPVHFGKDDADDLLGKGRAMVAAYTPPPGIIGVEQPFSIELDPALPPIEGRIDLIRRSPEGELTIADLKTSATRVLTETDGLEAQLSLYDIVYPATKHEAIVLGKLKTPTVTIQPITPWPVEQLRRHYREVHAAMCSGVSYAVRSWACESCSFRDRCRKDG